MIKVVLATRNKNKIHELKMFFKELSTLDITVLSLDDIGYYGEIEENGATFEENAISKASVPARLGYIGIADDSGICVEALGGAPGIYSARFSGGNDEDNNDLLLKKLNGKSNRNAKYVCAMACVFPDHSNDFTVRGECFGKILTKRVGTGGFGYDPLFYFEPFGKTFAEVELSKKNTVSHRAVAMRSLIKKLTKVLSHDK
ncbi:MAG: RdgB/HAM1 family non-canonical purine NTP pyrophosphatase [Clostridia bacterium]|nr:RdgB/HAM1 family non-canonical purine NTP pyrophosphatase [Clostridia bacterium]